MTLFHLLTEGTRALEQTGNPDAKTDAQRLLLTAFHMDLVHFLLNRMQELEENEYHQSCIALYHEMIAKRRRRIPLQQILGSQEFMGLDFFVNQYVLIPRQDTETLVELVLEEQNDPNKTLLDICTGSGCIAISLAVKGGYASVTATDLSEEALKVAEKNADKHGVTVNLLQGDLFGALEHTKTKKFDVITSNPPYIPTAVIKTLEPEVREHEPMLALDGTEDGLFFYRRIAKEAGAHLVDGGALYLEIGHDQGESVRTLLIDGGFSDVKVYKDLAGKDRVVRGFWN